MFSFILPIVFTICREQIRKFLLIKICKLPSLIHGGMINGAVEQASLEVKREMNNIIAGIFYKYIFNISIFLLAVFQFPKYFEPKYALLGICTVYAGSVLEVLYSFLKNLPAIFQFLVNSLWHGISQSIYMMLYKEVSLKVDKKIADLPWYKRWGAKAGMAIGLVPVPETFKHEITLAARRISFTYSFMIAAIISCYVIVFRLHVSPMLIKSTTHLSTMQAFAYPFAYSVDMFLKTDLIKYVV